MLKRSKDSKVTNAVTASGKAAVANSFGLPAGKAFSCPGETDVCGAVCYAGKLERIRPNVRNVMVNNLDTLRALDYAGMVEALSSMITDFEAESDKRGVRRAFRIHWDGDFFSEDYALAWAEVVRRHSETQFWVYTRVAFAAVALHKASLPNLALYFSTDDANAPIGAMLRRTYGIRLAYLADTFQSGENAMRSITGRPGARCPENAGQIALITPEGSACIRCGLCVDGKADVRFSASKR
jgi:hypothetical protein